MAEDTRVAAGICLVSTSLKKRQNKHQDGKDAKEVAKRRKCKCSPFYSSLYLFHVASIQYIHEHSLFHSDFWLP